MPIYEYQCSACEHRFDRLQKMSDAPLVTCPECGKDTLNKLVSAPSFRLSGSGWYETDFKTDKDKKKNLAGDAGKESAGNDKKSSEKDSASTGKTTKAANDSGSKTKSTSTKTA